MKSPLHVLHLEGNSSDAALVQSTLAAEGIQCETTRVQDRHEFVEALNRGGIDLILSDDSLPAFDGLSAAALVRRDWPEIPLILVSGTLGEELAIDSLKGGATDYVLKGRLSRLGPAVRRAMKEVDSVADRRRLEAHFIEAQKMEVVGRVAAGVAHDFNNILGVIIGYNQVIELKLPPDSQLRAYTKEIGHASDRAVVLTRQLLVYSRKQAVEPVVLDLNGVLAGIDNMLRRLVGADVRLVLVPGVPLGRVRADPGHLGQVLMNMAVNARDAMPHGGTLTITTSNASLDVAAADGVPSGEYLRVAVSDTGTGMTAAVQAHLFEPFFTTKMKGEGTGLGLATCLSIVQQCGGCIRVQSEVGRGTTFEVLLPRADQPLQVTESPIAAGLPRAVETALIVKDEPSVRQRVGRVLQALGYAREPRAVRPRAAPPGYIGHE